jgi:DNA helicase II / ATP-dependent DNA helicase PcrA
MSSPVEDPFTQYLNPPQAKAVHHVKGPLLVFAGAGSGKTRVITFRVANLIARHRVAPYRILAVTFTNKAAGEMRSRLSKILGEEIGRDIAVGTFHATCARLLRRHAESVGLTKSFVIYDDSDQRALVGRVLKDLGLDDRSYPPKTLLARIHKEKQEGRTPEDVQGSGFADEVLIRVFEAYQRHLRTANAVDFEDLIGHVMRLAESEGFSGRELRERFDHVLVDEFQDTNQVQYRLVRALVQKHHNLCVVGDDDQSIYRWRGGDVRIIRGYKRDFPEAEVIKLEENYRSTARIVRAALSVIKPSREREPKELFTNNSEGSKITVVLARDERDEATFVIGRVKDAISRGIDPRELAVFYRIHAMSRVVEEAFRAEGLPYRIVGGMRFFERAEVKDLLSYLRVAANPRSDVDVLRVINTPTRGIGDGTIAKVTEIAFQRGTSMYDALDAAADVPSIAAAARKKLAAFRDMIEGFRKGVDRMLPSELALRILDESGYRKMLDADDSAESDARLQNLEELIGSLKEYEEEAEAGGGAPTLEAYLERVTLSSSADESEDTGRVSLMTVHAAKGLEFEEVFLLGMEEELFPYERRGDENGMDEEEERRLAYVAITRARKRLFLTQTAIRTLFGNTRYGRPSRFVLDLPRQDLDTLATSSAAAMGIDARAGLSSAPRPGVSTYGGGRPLSSYGGGYGGGYGGSRPQASPSYERPSTSYQRPSTSSERPAPSSSPATSSPILARAAAARGAIARPIYPGRVTVPDPEPVRRPGERYVERDPDVDAPELDEGSFRRGTRVRHPRFGDGTVLSVEEGMKPSATVRFPGWGEKKILLQFLQPV